MTILGLRREPFLGTVSRTSVPQEFSGWMRRGTSSKEVLKGKTILAPAGILSHVFFVYVCMPDLGDVRFCDWKRILEGLR